MFCPVKHPLQTQDHPRLAKYQIADIRTVKTNTGIAKPKPGSG